MCCLMVKMVSRIFPMIIISTCFFIQLMTKHKNKLKQQKKAIDRLVVIKDFVTVNPVFHQFGTYRMDGYVLFGK